MQPYNPYAAPTTAAESTYCAPIAAPSVTLEVLEEARRQLNAFLADPAQRASEARLRRSRVRTPVWVVGAASLVLMIAALVALATQASTLAIAALTTGGVCLLVALAALGFDLRCPRRDRPGGPDTCLSGYLSALRFARFGYAVSCLCPTARARPVDVPSLGPVVTGTGRFTLETAEAMKAYARTFATHGHGQARLLRASRARVRSTSGDLAEVEADVRVFSCPRWVMILGVTLIVVTRAIGMLVYLALYFGLRKGYRATIRKWAIRGQDGVYYLYDADITGP